MPGEVTLESLGFDLKEKPPTNKWTDQFSILCGLPKTGKSEFLAQGKEKNWFVRMAAEFNHLATYGVDVTDLGSVLKEVEKLTKAYKAGVFPWETIIFDPADKLLEYMQDQICSDCAADSIYEVAGYGVGQRKYKMGIKSFVSSILPLPAHKFFVFHTKWIEMKDPGDSKKTYHRWELDLSEKLDAEFKRRVHNVD